MKDRRISRRWRRMGKRVIQRGTGVIREQTKMQRRRRSETGGNEKRRRQNDVFGVQVRQGDCGIAEGERGKDGDKAGIHRENRRPPCNEKEEALRSSRTSLTINKASMGVPERSMHHGC